jgi:hypothetical protein
MVKISFNQVLQKALVCAEEPEYQILISVIYNLYPKTIASKMDKLRTFQTFGSKLYNKLLSLYPELIRGDNNKKSIPGMKSSQQTMGNKKSANTNFKKTE